MRFAMCNELYENWAFDAVCQFLKGPGTRASRWRRLRWRRASPTSPLERRGELRRRPRTRASKSSASTGCSQGPEGLHLTSPDPAVRANRDYMVELAEARELAAG